MHSPYKLIQQLSHTLGLSSSHLALCFSITSATLLYFCSQSLPDLHRFQPHCLLATLQACRFSDASSHTAVLSCVTFPATCFSITSATLLYFPAAQSLQADSTFPATQAYFPASYLLVLQHHFQPHCCTFLLQSYTLIQTASSHTVVLSCVTFLALCFSITSSHTVVISATFLALCFSITSVVVLFCAVLHADSALFQPHCCTFPRWFPCIVL